MLGWGGRGRGDSLSQKMSHKGNEKSSCIVAVLICYRSIWCVGIHLSHFYLRQTERKTYTVADIWQVKWPENGIWLWSCKRKRIFPNPFHFIRLMKQWLSSTYFYFLTARDMNMVKEIWDLFHNFDLQSIKWCILL